MPDLKPPVVDAPNNGREPTAGTATTDPAGGDPLARLHKMSTTAGLGSQEYVAVNAPAVFALIFGLASALVIVENILLIIPIAGLVCGVLAFYQIGKSAGTQTGRGLAALGMLLSLGFAGYVISDKVTEASRTRADREAITKLMVDFGNHIKAGEFQQARALFSARFQERVSQEEFDGRVKFLQDSPYGKLASISHNDVFGFESDQSTGQRYGRVLMLIQFDKSEQPLREEGIFHKSPDGTWAFEDIPNLFRPPQQGPPGGPGGPGGMG